MTGAVEAEAGTVRPRAGAARAFVEWAWRTRALREARQFRRGLPLSERQALERALVAGELGDRAFDPVDPLRSGSSLGLAISLYREAAYFALLAQNQDYAGSTLAALFDGVPADLLTFAAGGTAELAEVRRALVERSFVETAELPAELLPRDARVAQAFVHALIRRKLAPEQQLGTLLRQRITRTLGLLLLLLLVGIGSWLELAALRRGPNLAAGKPWHASSSPDTCHPAEHRCAGAHTDMFFTTNEESEPWLVIDLRQNTAFNALGVTNRSDCCPDRAVPLIVEVSRDQQKWREVSRRNETFSTWQARFAPQLARYVRLRVPRRTIFHLDKVEVRNDR